MRSAGQGFHNGVDPGGSNLNDDFALAGNRLGKRLVDGRLAQNIDDCSLHDSTSIGE